MEPAARKGRIEVSSKLAYLMIIAGCCLILSSCARIPVKPVVYPQVVPAAIGARQDVYHVVGPGETIWRIGKMYDVKMEDIAQANNLRNLQELKMGQRLLIPQAKPIRPVVSLYPSNRWKYIIVHHSASDEGNALGIYKAHRSRGWETVGYDFVIDNGTDGKVEGQIEATPRWIKQIDGAHCKAGGMNAKGIGICLVGNFSQEGVPQKQMESLVYLVNILRNYYDIPTQNILGHGKVPGAKTECPGKNFLWQRFYSELN
jgi:N-acetylmuramoyl-L-alanine amidase